MQDDSPFEYRFPDGHVVELSFAPGVKAKYFPKGKPDWDALLPHAERAYQLDIAKYNQDWLGERSSGSTPALRYREYATSKNQKNFDFQGLSPLGQRAIREKFAAEQRASMARESKAMQDASNLYFSGLDREGAEDAAAGKYISGALFPAANRRMTAAVTGQEASRALPLGLDPQGQLNTGRGFVPGFRRGAGKLGTAEGIAGTATAVAAAPAAAALAANYPILALLGAGASFAPTASNIMQGNYGEATADILPALLGTKITKPISSARQIPSELKKIGPAIEAYQRGEYASPLQRITRLTKELSNIQQEQSSLGMDVTKTVSRLKSTIQELNNRADLLEIRGNDAAAANLRSQARDIETRLAKLNL